MILIDEVQLTDNREAPSLEKHWGRFRAGRSAVWVTWCQRISIGEDRTTLDVIKRQPIHFN